ncbi:MAG: PHP domain-containing protein [Candidatus Eisenbacteria bacterium]
MTARDDPRIDLHLHTIASDGSETAETLVLKAKSLGLAAIAITDHDTVGSVREALAAGEKHGIEVIPGVEIGIAHDPERHLIEIDILGYFIDPDFAELEGVLQRLQHAKNGKLLKQIAVLAENGLPIEVHEVLEAAAGDTVRRPHIWKVLHRHHPDFSSQEFFDRTSFGGEWHVSKDFSLQLEESVELIERAGGVPVLAHPGAYNTTFAKGGGMKDPIVDEIVATCAGAGVRGLEVYYTYDKNRPFHNGGPLISQDELAELVGHYASLADGHGMLKTGGTDFHGATKPQIEVGEVDARYSLLQALKDARPAV